MGVLYNLSSRIIRRTLAIPTKGLPSAQACREPFDEALGVRTSGIVWLTNFRSSNFHQGVRYEPCSPAKCIWGIENSGIDPKEFGFIDVGCGKGRPLIIANQYNFAELIGVEYSPKLCRIARANLQKLDISARVICQDAAQFQFPERDVFVFFYHPFESVVLHKVLDNLRAARRVVVCYEGAGRKTVGQHGWLSTYKTLDDTALYRNF
jgi:SAM-dependent methyltransferase